MASTPESYKLLPMVSLARGHEEFLGVVSILCPAHNSERYLEAAIQSVLGQAYPHWELIVIDDASTDRSLEIAKKFASIDSRVAVLESSTNRGVANSRNAGLKVSKGRWVALLDADDVWLPNRLAVSLKHMLKFNSPLTYSSYRVINELGTLVGPLIRAPRTLRYRQLLRSNVIGASTAMFDREKTKDLTFPLVPLSDFAFWSLILKLHPVAFGAQEELVHYRLSQNAVSKNKLRQTRRVWNHYRKQESLPLVKSVQLILVWASIGLSKHGYLQFMLLFRAFLTAIRILPVRLRALDHKRSA